MDETQPHSNKLNKSLSISDLRHHKFRVEELYHSEPTRHTLIRHISWEQPIKHSSAPSYVFSEIISATGNAIRGSWSTSTKKIRIMSTETGSKDVAHDVSNEAADSASSIFDSDSFHAFGFTKKLPDNVEYRPIAKTDRSVFECSDMNSMKDVHEMSPNCMKPGKKVPKLDKNEANETPSRPKKLRHLSNKTNPTNVEAKRSIWIVMSFVTLPIFVLVMGLVLFDYQSEGDHLNPHCNAKFPSDSIIRSLHSNLFGQDRAISILTQVFDTLAEQTLLVFLGGTGVGKTYASSIIMRNMKRENVHLMVLPSNSIVADERKIVNSLSPCGHNVVVVDTLKPEEAFDIVPFVDVLFATQNKVVLVLIFNAQKHSDDLKLVIDMAESRALIDGAFERTRFKPVTVVFEQLGHETLVKCIRKSLAERNIRDDDDAVEFVVSNVDVVTSGCKRVDTKAALLKAGS